MSDVWESIHRNGTNLASIAWRRPEYTPFILAFPVLAVSFLSSFALAYILNPKFDPILKEKVTKRLRLGLIMHFSSFVVRGGYYSFMICSPSFFQRKFPELELRDLRKALNKSTVVLCWLHLATHIYLWFILVPWIIWAKATGKGPW